MSDKVLDQAATDRLLALLQSGALQAQALDGQWSKLEEWGQLTLAISIPRQGDLDDLELKSYVSIALKVLENGEGNSLPYAEANPKKLQEAMSTRKEKFGNLHPWLNAKYAAAVFKDTGTGFSILVIKPLE